MKAIINSSGSGSLLLLSQFIGITLFCCVAIRAQYPDYQNAVVIKNDPIRTAPSVRGKVLARPRIGTQVMVTPALTPGWYLVKLPVSQIVVGFIHGKSLRLSGLDSGKAPAKITVLDLDAEKTRQIAVNPQKPSGTNYCKLSLFCPDIVDVQTAIFENRAKLIKGKFEKTADWEKRRATLQREIPLGNSRNLSEKLYFFYDYSLRSPVPTEWEYDADRESWTLSFEVKREGGRTYIPVFSPRTGLEFYLIISGDKLASSKALISMTPAKAAANDKKIELAFGGRVVEPLPDGDAASSEIHFSLEDIIGINPATGEYWKATIETQPTPKVSQFEPTNTTRPVSEIDALKRELIRDPQNASAFVRLGQKYIAAADLTLAIESFNYALLWDPSLIDAQIGLARSHMLKGDHRTAQYHIDKALAINEQNTEALTLKRLVSDPVPLLSDQSSTSPPSAKPLEGEWKMTLQLSGETLQMTLSILRVGSKLKGVLNTPNHGSSKMFDIRQQGKGGLNFEVSEKIGFFSSAKLKFAGVYDGFQITGQALFQSGTYKGSGDFNSVR